MRVPSARLLAFLSVLAVLSACTDGAPTSTGPGIVARNERSFSANLASPAWQAMIAASVPRASLPGVTPVRLAMNPLQAAHAYALLGVAQYLAVQQAGSDGDDDENRRKTSDRERGAVAGASAVVLTYLFPADAASFDDLVRAQATAAQGAGRSFARGEAAGRAVGAAIVTRAQNDHFGLPLNPTPPSGPGYWTKNPAGAAVAGADMPGVTPWFLTSADQFRPAAPPAYLSADFNTALAEIRNFSDHRTADQARIAAYWALNAGTVTAAGFWLQVATDDINARGLSEREATHLYALLSASMFDAGIGCWDAKLTYWYIRPWQADPLIALFAPVGRPYHPSYPSGHSCVSSSGAAVLSEFFPDQRAQLDAMVTEAGLSRMYGGIHYRFDIEAGQMLGRSVAQFAIAADRAGHSVLNVDDKDDDRDHDRDH
jgi:membrane-associated phospholipid phosphatase